MPASKVNVFSYWKALFAAVLLVFTAPAFAQDADDETKTEKEKDREDNLSVKSGKKFERVEVTGSLIRRSDFEGPSPIEIIDRKALDETAYNSVADYVRDLPISSFGSTRESSGNTAAGASTINLRGLGASNTLVLLNGARLPIDGNLGAVNMNLIPEIIIDGVEILKDGASATYGSDAIGGVVAIKSRKNFTGVEASLKQSITEESGGDRTDMGLIYGKQFGAIGPFTAGSVTAAAQYRFNSKIYSRDRSWSEPDDQGIAGWSAFGPVPNYINDAGNFNFIPEQCAAAGDQSFVITDGPDSYCGFPFASRATSLPEIQQLSGYANVELEIGTRNRISTTALVSRQETEWIYAPAVATPADGFVIPAARAGTIYQGGPLPGTSGTADVPFTYRTLALGDRVTQTSNDSYYIQSEYVREFAETWEWKTSLAYSSNDKNAVSPQGYALAAPLGQAVADGLFNPFDPNDDGSALQAATYVPFQKTTSNSVVGDSRVNGEVMAFGANDQNVLGAAFGVQYIHSEFRDVVDGPTAAGQVFGSAGSNGAGQRDVMATYAELSFNIGRMWEFQAAARYDRFSDFGDAFSPKLGVKFRPFDSFMMRASYGKAFKAPLLTQLYASDSIGNPSFIDAVKCKIDEDNGVPDSSACRESQHRVESGGNPGLEEERSTSYGVGFIYEPFKGFAIGSDYWAVDQTNVVDIDYEEMTKAELAGIDLSASGVSVQRDGNGNIVNVIAPTLNLSSLEQSGLDINISYTFKTAIGRFRISDAHSQTFEVLQSGFPGVAKRDYLDDYRNPEWRNSAGLTYSPNRTNAISLNYNSLAGQKTVDRNSRISSYGELEVTYTTTLPWWQGTTLTAGVRNITGETPPFDPNGGAQPFNANLYSQLNRYGYLNLRHAF
jgi:iron complex outermembrane receptor protein